MQITNFPSIINPHRYQQCPRRDSNLLTHKLELDSLNVAFILDIKNHFVIFYLAMVQSARAFIHV